jgi:hypothetical protein
MPTCDRKMKWIETAEAICNAHLFQAFQQLTRQRKR